jgi:hypothetical protein
MYNNSEQIQHPNLNTVNLDASYYRIWNIMDIFKLPINIEDSFQLGNIRNLIEYCDFTGLHWNERFVYPWAFVGMSLKNKNMFLDEEVISKYGSWTKFLEKTDYRSDKIYYF